MDYVSWRWGRAKYTTSDWENLAKQMNSLVEQNNISWFVSTSRRTGRAEKVLKGILKSENIIDAVWWCEQLVKHMPFSV